MPRSSSARAIETPSRHGESCADLGFLYFYGNGVPKDEARAFLIYQKACALGAGLGCGLLAETYNAGRGTEKNPAYAAKLAAKACQMGDAVSCDGFDARTRRPQRPR